MDSSSSPTSSWRYCVRDNQVFCPRRNADVDVKICSTCVHLQSDPSTGWVVCLQPAGRDTSEMIDTVASY